MPRSCIALNDFLSSKRKQYPAMVPEILLGIWIDPGMTSEIPESLAAHNQAAYQQVYIRETTGLQGIWTICWLQASDEKGHHEVSRLILFDALIELTSHRQENPAAGCFIPVFPSQTPWSQLKIEMRCLLAVHPQQLMSAWLQDSATGLLIHNDLTQRDGLIEEPTVQSE